MYSPESASTALSPDGYVLGPGEGRKLMLPAGPLTLKIDSETSRQSVAAWEDVVAPGSGLLLHIHHHCDELFLVLQGEFEFRVNDNVSNATRGSFVFIPRGAKHTYRCTGTQPGKLFGFAIPSGLEEFYVAQSRVPPNEMTPALYESLGRKYDFDAVPD